MHREGISLMKPPSFKGVSSLAQRRGVTLSTLLTTIEMKLDELNSATIDHIGDETLKIPSSPLIPFKEFHIQLPDYLETPPQSILKKRTFTEADDHTGVSTELRRVIVVKKRQVTENKNEQSKNSFGQKIVVC